MARVITPIMSSRDHYSLIYTADEEKKNYLRESTKEEAIEHLDGLLESVRLIDFKTAFAASLKKNGGKHATVDIGTFHNWDIYVPSSTRYSEGMLASSQKYLDETISSEYYQSDFINVSWYNKLYLKQLYKLGILDVLAAHIDPNVTVKVVQGERLESIWGYVSDVDDTYLQKDDTGRSLLAEFRTYKLMATFYPNGLWQNQKKKQEASLEAYGFTTAAAVAEAAAEAADDCPCCQ
jgi:hypothetical protein